MSVPPSWDEQLFALFDDLEGQASALYELEREAELADRSRAEYRHVTLESRLVATVGSALVLTLVGARRVEGELQRVGRGWCLVSGHAQDWIVRTHHVEVVVGASQRSVPEVAWSPLQRLGISSALRRLAETRVRCVIHLVDGGQHEAVIRRVGADFVEIGSAAGMTAIIAQDAISAVQSRG